LEWTGFIWLRIRTGEEFLWTRYWTFGFHKMLGNSRVVAQLAVSQEGFSSVQSVISLGLLEPRKRGRGSCCCYGRRKRKSTMLGCRVVA
jgi:hypothetical protein